MYSSLPTTHPLDRTDGQPRSPWESAPAQAAPAHSMPGRRFLDQVIAHPIDGPALAWGSRALPLAEHRARYGTREPWVGRLWELLDRLERSGLTGRGGAHFPAVKKWQAVAAAGSRPTLIANAAEGEPWSAKDATLLQLRPHLVLDGLAAAAEALGADDVVIWVSEDSTASIHAVRMALSERAGAGLGEPPIRIVAVAHHYLAGESSAIVNALTNGISLPQFQQQPAAVAGVNGRPTLIQNIETFGRIGLLARSGGVDEPSQLVTLATPSARFVAEVAPGETISEVVWRIDQEFPMTNLTGSRPQAVLLGGFGGEWIGWHEAARLPLDEASLRPTGHSLGAGVIHLLPDSGCGLDQTATILEFLAASGARQCGPCLFGLPEVSDSFAQLAAGKLRSRGLRRLEQTLGLIPGRGACHHPDGAAGLAASALTTFADDVRAHVRGRGCGGDHGMTVATAPASAGATS